MNIGKAEMCELHQGVKRNGRHEPPPQEWLVGQQEVKNHVLGK
jgi:hypothetical protein